MPFPAPQPLLGLLLALLPALGAPSARAASEPTPSELSVARSLFEQGRAAEDSGRWRDAAEKFLKATSIKDTPGMRFHLARCLEEQGELVEALVEYDRARELIDSGVRAADVEKLLAAARERVRAKVALLNLRLPSGIENVSVELDGKVLALSVLGVPMPINPGKHRVSAVAVGRATFATELTLGTGEVRQLAIELPVATTVPPPPPRAAAAVQVPSARRKPLADDDGVPARTLVLVGEAALFVASVGVGVGFSLARSSADDRYQDANSLVLEQVGGSDPKGIACATPRAGCADLERARQDRARDGALATGGFVAAGVTAAAFGLTYWLWPSDAPPAALRASTAPGGFELSVSGRF